MSAITCTCAHAPGPRNRWELLDQGTCYVKDEGQSKIWLLEWIGRNHEWMYRREKMKAFWWRSFSSTLEKWPLQPQTLKRNSYSRRRQVFRDCQIVSVKYFFLQCSSIFLQKKLSVWKAYLWFSAVDRLALLNMFYACIQDVMLPLEHIMYSSSRAWWDGFWSDTIKRNSTVSLKFEPKFKNYIYYIYIWLIK